jgi:hypothetical protein|tara:strand:- start:3159 stop:3767 length:609 start_codon:yes stop_codon:yes gene_type:complete
MKAQTTLFGRIVKRYDIPLDAIQDLNNRYEAHKEKLNSFGPRLAGRLDSEKEFTHLLAETKASKYMVDCMNDYVNTLDDLGKFDQEKKLKILSCWINDMKEGEYNPPHTHHDTTGWSTVMFLKVPKFIDDTKDPHKFKDGKLGFIGHDGIYTTWTDPEVGHFYIFEAAHQHCVMPFKTKVKGDIRRSMSFNFIVEGSRDDHD